MNKSFPRGGVHPSDFKQFSAHKSIVTVPAPQKAIIPLNQHIGAPATCCVEKGATVKVGDLLGTATGFVSANVHSPFAGTVTKIDTFIDAWGMKYPGVEITVDESCRGSLSVNPKDGFVKGEPLQGGFAKGEPVQSGFAEGEPLQLIKDAGIVGLGGACFPTHVKLSVPAGKKAEYLLINAVECEPYLTCDHQLILEHASEIVEGIKILQHVLGAEHVIIGIEANKKDAYRVLCDTCRGSLSANPENGFATGEPLQDIQVQLLPMKYPQGGEKQLIAALTGRTMPSGALPIDVGCVVDNVATVYAVYQAVVEGLPLIGRVMTVTGPSVKNPGNYYVRFGTPLADVVAMAGGIPEDTGKILCGGPMMGRAMKHLDMPANKRTSALLFLPKEQSTRKSIDPCVRCGKCVSVCPQGLEPYLLASGSMRSDWALLEEHHIMDCIECGCCHFTCPANRPLLDFIRLGKTTVGGIIRNRNKKV